MMRPARPCVPLFAFLSPASALAALAVVALHPAAARAASPPGVPLCRMTTAATTVPSALPAGTCTANEQCGQDDFCAKLFGSCDKNGKCEPKPQDCSERGHTFIKPVCGCDGKSYDNYCLAAAAGVNVKSEGKCPEAPDGGR